jgi:hypothetical protein
VYLRLGEVVVLLRPIGQKTQFDCKTISPTPLLVSLFGVGLFLPRCPPVFLEKTIFFFKIKINKKDVFLRIILNFFSWEVRLWERM